MEDFNTQTQSNSQETLRKTAEALLRLMGFSQVSVSLRQISPEEPLTVAVSTDDAGILIGDAGANLRAFEYVAKLVVRKMLPDSPRFIVDVNDYRREWIAMLKERAHDIASRVAREARDIALEPMPSYERRVVHTELTSRPDVRTESVGEGLERHVVVKPL